MARFRVPRSFEHIRKPHHIGIDVRTRIGERIADARLCRQMHYGIKTFTVEQCIHTSAITDIEMLKAEVVVLLQASESGFFQ